MTRTRIAVILSTGALVLAGCGAPAPEAVSAEAVALQEVGFVAEGASPAPDRDGPRVLRKHLRKNTLHGEVTVQGKDGPRTIVVQRGTVTAVDAKGLTVRSSDGFSLAWSYGEPVKVAQDRKPVERTAIRTGAEVGLGGVRDGSATAARLIILN